MPDSCPVTPQKSGCKGLATCAARTGSTVSLCLRSCLSGADNPVGLRTPGVAKQPEAELKGRGTLGTEPPRRVWQTLWPGHMLNRDHDSLDFTQPETGKNNLKLFVLGSGGALL